MMSRRAAAPARSLAGTFTVVTWPFCDGARRKARPANHPEPPTGIHNRSPGLGRHRDDGVAVTGAIEVGVDFPQSGGFKAFAQFADREGTERDPVLMWLNLAAVL